MAKGFNSRGFGGMGGIGGGIAGRALNKKMDNKAVDKLFLCLMAVIIGISVFNTWQYARVM